MIAAKVEGEEVEIDYKGTEEEIVEDAMILVDELFKTLATETAENECEKQWNYGLYYKALVENIDELVREGI